MILENNKKRKEKYLQTALEHEVTKLERTAKGGRNTQLNKAAFNLGQLIGHGLEYANVKEQLLLACDINGLLEEDGEAMCIATIKSGLQDGNTTLRLIPEFDSGAEYDNSVHASTPKTCNAESIRVSWQKGSIDGYHPYLKNKKIDHLHGTRIGRWFDNGTEHTSPMIPVKNFNDNTLCAIQHIYYDYEGKCRKKFHGKYKDYNGFFIFGRPEKRIAIAEGFATAATIFETINTPVAVAFTCTRLRALASLIRQRYTDSEIILISDLGDAEYKEAIRAAETVGGKVFLPKLPDGATVPEGKTLTDANDLFCLFGPEELSKQWKAYDTEISLIDPCEKCEKCEKQTETIPFSKIEHPESMSLQLMPDCLAKIVDHIAEHMQAPREIAWSVAISIIATAIGKRAKIKLPTHEEPSAIWTCTILPPGSRKSGVFSFFIKPLVEIEETLMKGYNEEILKWKSKKEIAEVKIQDIKRQLKGKKGKIDKLTMELMEEKRVIDDEPIEPCLYITDTTTEALRKVLHEQGSIGLLSAEGSSIIESFGRYNGNKGADMSLFLAAHAGDPDKGARVSGTKGNSSVLATIGITAQPDVLISLLGDNMACGRGLVSRFFFLLPESPCGQRNYFKNTPLSSDIETKWSDMIHNILINKIPDIIPIVEVNEKAGKAWLTFAQEIEDRQQKGHDLREMSGFASKLAGQVGRIALIYHYSQGFNHQDLISEQTMLQSIGMGLTLIEHAKVAMQMVGENDATKKAIAVAEGIARHDMDTVRPWEIAKKHLGGCKNTADAKERCFLLADHGYLIPIDKLPTKGRQPKEQYSVHNDLFSHFSHSSQGI